MLLAWNLQQGREGRLIPIDSWADPLCDLHSMSAQACRISYGNLPCSLGRMFAYVLVDQEDGNVFPLCVVLERRLDNVGLRFYEH